MDMKRISIFVLGVLVVFSLGIGLYNMSSQNTIGTVSGANKVWTESSPLEIEVLSIGNVGVSEPIIEEYNESADSGYVKTTDGVYWENEKGKISVTPHTCSSFHCEFKLDISNKDSIDNVLDMAFTFPDNTVNHRFYQLEIVTKTRPTYTQVEHSVWIEGNTTDTQGYWNNYTSMEQNGTEEYQVSEYVDRSSAFVKTTINGKDVFYTSNINFKALKTRNAKFVYDVIPTQTTQGFDASGKWEMYLWEGDYNNPTWSLKLDPWYESSRIKRQLITINNTDNPSTLIDFQTYVNLTAQAEMNSDYSDLIFTWVNGSVEQQIPHIIGSDLDNSIYRSVAGAYTDVWLRMPNITGSGTEPVYAYYQNITPVTSQSDGYAVFENFDNFDDGSINTTEWNASTGTPVESGGYMILNDSTFEGIIANTNNTQPAIIEYYFNRSAETAGFQWRVGLHDNIQSFDTGRNSVEIIFSDPITANTVRSVTFNSGTATVTGYILNSGPGFTHAKHVWNSTRASWIINGTEEAGHTTTIPTVDLRANFQTMGSGTLYIDWVLTRKYTPIEPTYTLGAIEEGFGWTVQLDAPTNGFTNTTVNGNTTFYATPINDLNATAYPVNSTLYSNVTGTWGERFSNTTALSNATQFAIVGIEYPDGIYEWNMLLCGSDQTTQCVFAPSNFTYTVASTPQYSDISVDPASPQTYNISDITFNITWFDDGNNTNNTWITHNFTGSVANYTMSNSSVLNETTNYTYSLGFGPSAGNYTYQFWQNDTAGNVNNTANITYTLNKADAGITISSSQGFVIEDGSTSTLECTSNPSFSLAESMTLDAVVISNPFTGTFTEGIYNITCSVVDTTNFTNSVVSQSLTVNPVSLCTNDETFGFGKDVVATGGIKSWDFTDLVNQNRVDDNLTDVWIPNATLTDITTTINSTNHILNVDETALNMSTYVLEFGNQFFADRTYATGTVNNTNIDNLTAYSQINPIVDIRQLNEIDFVALSPPNATVDMFINCDLGESHVGIPAGETSYMIALANNNNLKILEQIRYDSASFYSRQYYPATQDSLALNIYLVDALEFPLSRIDFVMDDFNLYDGNIEIYRSVSSGDIIFTEGFFDENHKFSAYLREDADYFIRVIDGSTTNDFGRKTVVQPEEVLLTNTKIGLSSDAVLLEDNILMNAVMNANRTQITIQYQDDLNETDNLTVTILYQNGTVFDNSTYTANSVLAQHNTTGYEDEAFTVDYILYHQRYGNSPVLNSITLFPDVLFDLGITSTYLYILLATVIIVGIGAITVRSSLLFGLLIVPILTALFTGFGWIDQSLGYILTAFVIFLSAITFAHEMKTRGES